MFYGLGEGPSAKGKVGVEIFQLSQIYAVAGGAKRVLVIEELGYTVQTYRANCAWMLQSMRIISMASKL